MANEIIKRLSEAARIEEHGEFATLTIRPLWVTISLTKGRKTITASVTWYEIEFSKINPLTTKIEELRLKLAQSQPEVARCV